MALILAGLALAAPAALLVRGAAGGPLQIAIIAAFAVHEPCRIAAGLTRPPTSFLLIVR